MHDLLIANQEALQMEDLVRFAGELDLDIEQFESDLRSGRHASRVAQDVNTAEEAGVAGTPTFFINEVLHRGGYDRDSLRDALERVARLTTGRRRERAQREEAEDA
jgi:predicted DsbA family dithiol-disulfide isomerase